MTEKLKKMIKEQGLVIVNGNLVSAAKLTNGFVLYRSDPKTVSVANAKISKTFFSSPAADICLETVCEHNHEF